MRKKQQHQGVIAAGRAGASDRSRRFTRHALSGPSLVWLFLSAGGAAWAADAVPEVQSDAPVAEAEATVAAESQVSTDAASGVDTVQVTARRRQERAQDVPIPLTVIGGDFVNETQSFNIDRLKQVIPTVQFYSTNPRNSAITVRGLGSPFGLTNDGIDPGVGLYIDGVFYARPAAATLDFIDVEQVEVLRGPQGTLYGKNTSAGAVNVTTRRPSFTPGSTVEFSAGDYGFLQAKASITGPVVADKIAARLSVSGTQRDGVLRNVATQDDLNDLNNLGVRGQLLFQASESLEFLLAGDTTRQRPEGYAQVVAGVAPTLRAANRQFAGIIADLNYTPPSYDAFDRITDTDTPWRSRQDLGGLSLTANWKLGPGTLTSITAWRYWDWDPSNDRDFLGLPITTISAANSKQRQWSQEVRYSADLSDSLNTTFGAYAFRQTIDSDPIQFLQYGAAAARFLLNPGAAGYRADLLDGYGLNTIVESEFDSVAVFGQLEWKLTDTLRLLPGLRVNFDRKSVDFESQTYGGPDDVDAAGQALQRTIVASQTYDADVDDTDVSGQLTLSYQPSSAINAYATYAKSYKSVGLNTAGVPNGADGLPALNLATVKPEDINHYELGIKTQPFRRTEVNLSVFQTDVKDYQAQVVNALAQGLLRGYLANADKARVRGVELDASTRVGDSLSLRGSVAYTDAEYVRFTNAPARLEDTGGPQVVDISGERLPGVSKWAGTVGGEYTTPGQFLGREGAFFVALDGTARSDFSSSATPSRYLDVPGYTLWNSRIGFRASNGWDVYLWARNLTDKDYYELLSAAAGGSGLYVGLPGDPRTIGATVRAEF